VVEVDGGSGNCIHKVDLDPGILWSWHAIEVTTQVPGTQYIVSHGYYDQHNHCVSLVGATNEGGKVRRYGGVPGSGPGSLYVPYHLAVDAADGTIFVADHHNGRVVVLSPALEFVQCIATQGDELKSRPRRLCLDSKSRLLYVGQDDGTLTVLRL